MLRTRDEAIKAAQDVVARVEKIGELVQQLKKEDMLGLECSETVQIEMFQTENAVAAMSLASWILREYGA